jgi:phospholipid-binding lipoprotein MlaA
MTNSTFGVLGLFDVATRQGVEYHVADFGQTLGRYGVPPGPYLFIPVLGPSTFRDLGGRVVDTTADPVSMIRFDGRTAVRYGRAAVFALETRADFDDELQEFDRTAIDPYVSLRSAYLQNRQDAVRGGKLDVDGLPDFTPEPEAPGPDASSPRSQ